MFSSRQWTWITRSLLIFCLVSAAAVRPARAQHDLGAENTHHFNYSAVNGKGGEEISGPYEAVPDWPQPIHPDWVMGRVAGVYAESPDRIYVATTGELPAHLYERAWGPHYFDVDSEGNLYLAEDYNARVQKFRPKKDADRDQLVDVTR